MTKKTKKRSKRKGSLIVNIIKKIVLMVEISKLILIYCKRRRKRKERNQKRRRLKLKLKQKLVV